MIKKLAQTLLLNLSTRLLNKQFRHDLLKFFYPAVRWLGGLHLPFTHKKVSALMVRDMIKVMRPGDILVSTALGEFSNLLIKGRYKHVSIFCSEHCVVESVKQGVRSIDIFQALMTRDRVMVLRSLEATPEQAKEAADIAMGLIGTPYDWGFMIPERDSAESNKEFYCAELIWHCHRVANPDTKFTLREVFGVRTVIPDHFAEAKKYWQTVWSSDKV